MRVAPDHLHNKRGLSWLFLLATALLLVLVSPTVVKSFCERLWLWTDSEGLRLFSDGQEMSWEAVSGFVSGFLTFASLCLVAVIYYFDARSGRLIAQRETYQQLEMSSIELFRFECEQVDIVSLLWDDDSPPLESLSFSKQYAVKAYVFQVLNLFEMAIRFRKQGIMEPEVFGSWIIWIYELCSAPRFQEIWEEAKMNYVGLLADSLNEGIALCRASNVGEADARKEFFRMFEKKLRCKAIRRFVENRF